MRVSKVISKKMKERCWIKNMKVKRKRLHKPKSKKEEFNESIESFTLVADQTTKKEGINEGIESSILVADQITKQEEIDDGIESSSLVAD